MVGEPGRQAENRRTPRETVGWPRYRCRCLTQKGSSHPAGVAPHPGPGVGLCVGCGSCGDMPAVVAPAAVLEGIVSLVAEAR